MVTQTPMQSHAQPLFADSAQLSLLVLVPAVSPIFAGAILREQSASEFNQI